MYLEVLVLDDGALLTSSFWNSMDKDFANPDALNYAKTGSHQKLLDVVSSLLVLVTHRAVDARRTFQSPQRVLPPFVASSASHLIFLQCAGGN